MALADPHSASRDLARLQHRWWLNKYRNKYCNKYRYNQDKHIANEQIGSSCYETTPVIPLETPALAESSAWQAAGAAKEEDSGSLCNPKHLCDCIEKVINPVRRPAGKRRGAGVRSVAEECGKGVLQAGGGGAGEKEDTDSPWDSETDPNGQGKVWASEWLPAANSNRLDARSAAHFSEIVEVFAGKQHCSADHKGVSAHSAAAEHSKVLYLFLWVLEPAGGAGEDGDSSWDSETDSEGEWKVSAAIQLPAANSNRLDAPSAAVECGKGVLKQGWRKVKKADRVLQPAGQEANQEDDFPWDSKTDSEGQWKALADVQLPAADRNRVGVSSAAVERSKAARAEQKEHFISSSENKLPTLQGEVLWTKVDSSTQTDSQQDDFLLGIVLVVLQLKDLKEPLNKNDYYAESGKNALKETKVIKILRNMQSCLTESLDAAAILQLEEHFQWLDRKMAALDDMIQQQAKTIKFFETIQ
ncbi:hypothetical protein HGM15179_012471 [Zosterops borbonicus]|uniref:Uncharacterized protein n=1 Tax=Zosterops borbonicus TaxID=364589 RepID=A0A8K1LHV2_9PASS|nr:hypothetical protein HGM15179_012471 [Zosterops borbonicus]